MLAAVRVNLFFFFLRNLKYVAQEYSQDTERYDIFKVVRKKSIDSSAQIYVTWINTGWWVDRVI